MVRCGVVSHPREWEWVGYHEIMGQRQRYRLLDLERLCWRLATETVEEVRANLEAAFQEQNSVKGLFLLRETRRSSSRNGD